MEEAPKLIRFALYFPLGNGETELGALLQALEEFLCAAFGGLTSYPGTGLFRRQSGTIQRESVQVLEGYCSPEVWAMLDREIDRILPLLARAMNQQSIAFSYNGELRFVRPSGHSQMPIGDLVKVIRAEACGSRLNNESETGRRASEQP